MNKFLKRIIGDIEDKKEWKTIEERTKLLPADYQIVYNEIKHYIWNVSSIITLAPFGNLLNLFEEGSKSGKPVLKITGNDIALFTDELIRNEKTYRDELREKLNYNISIKLKK